MHSSAGSLKIAIEGRLLRLTLARPEKRNALNLALCRAITNAIEGASPDDFSCILIDAEGPVFCAGMDLAESTVVDQEDLADVHERLFSLNRRSKVPIVAYAQGAALAAGTGLAAQAHLLVAAEEARFGLTEVRVGMWPMFVYRSVEAAIGERRTLEWSLTGRPVEAREALDAGLVHRIGDKAAAEALAAELCSRSVEALRFGMRYYADSRVLDFAEAGQLARRLRRYLMTSQAYLDAAGKFKKE